VANDVWWGDHNLTKMTEIVSNFKSKVGGRRVDVRMTYVNLEKVLRSGGIQAGSLPSVPACQVSGDK
jgi:hypothetical protein